MSLAGQPLDKESTAEKSSQSLLTVDDVSIGFDTDDGLIRVVENISFTLQRGKTLALVGESGCGKSLSALALLNLLPSFGSILSGRILLEGQDLSHVNEKIMRRIRGDRIAMIFQEPMSALNPVFTVGAQVAESFRLHRGLSKRESQEKAIEVIASVGIPDPKARAKNYPHELSGGMRQRVMIAMALACEPDILIADEPTTALGVTIQAQILDLMQELQAKHGTAILFISHDFNVVSRMADDIAVMYAGKIVEYGTSRDILANAIHPYTKALLETTPRIGVSVSHLPAIAGRVPGPAARPAGCYFQPRCPISFAQCQQVPELISISPTHRAACFSLCQGELDD
ncbi:ABC transporter ATP-binding protein [Aurantivibrio plasticivorans]